MCQFFLYERKRRNLKELAQVAEQYLDAHNKKLSSKPTLAKQDERGNKLAGSGSQRDVLRCFACNDRGHRAVDYSRRTSTSRIELNSRFRRNYCCKCGSTGYDTKNCRNSSSRTQPTQQRSGGRSTGGTSTQNQQIACAMQVSRKTEEKEAEKGIDTLELKTGEKIEVLTEFAWM